MTVADRPHKKSHERWGKERTMYVGVVGLQFRVAKIYYDAMVDALPLRVDFVREPSNQFDANAIKVVLADPIEHIDHFHIGYVPRDMAAVLAPKLDQDAIWLEASALMELEGDSGQVLISFHKKIYS